VLSRDKYCVLIILNPSYSYATYFDSGSSTKKRYANIIAVLNQALQGYAQKGGVFDKKASIFVNPQNKLHHFKHVTQFSCLKEQPGSVMDAFYALRHINMLIRDAAQLILPSALQTWVEYDKGHSDKDLRKDFQRIKTRLSEVILEDVIKVGGTFNCRRGI
jgi:hypothetical protein